MAVVSTSKSARKAKENGTPVKADRGSKSNGHSGSDHLDPLQLLNVLTAVKRGDFSPRLPLGGDGTPERSTTHSTRSSSEMRCSRPSSAA